MLQLNMSIIYQWFPLTVESSTSLTQITESRRCWLWYFSGCCWCNANIMAVQRWHFQGSLQHQTQQKVLKQSFWGAIVQMIDKSNFLSCTKIWAAKTNNLSKCTPKVLYGFQVLPDLFGSFVAILYESNPLIQTLWSEAPSSETPSM